jgi:periplasmic divalent cation tolerance protein
MSLAILVISSVPDNETAKIIATELLNRKLCACVSIIPQIKSFYWWQDKIEESSETLLHIKSTHDNYQAIESIIKNLHPYTVPEIIMLEISDVSSQYLQWIQESIDKTS